MGLNRPSRLACCTLSLLALLLVGATTSVEAWGMGEILPVDLQMRLKRGATAIARDDVEDAEDTEVADVGVQMLERPLSPDYCPRFGINKRVHLPATDLFQRAEQKYNETKTSPSDVALRFRLGRGLGKSSSWVPLLRAAEIVRATDIEKMNIRPRFLASITFSFGYQEGTFSKLTSFKVEPVYTTVRHDDVELSYHWDEHRAYNPHRALSVCAFVSLCTTILVLHIILFGKEGVSKYFKNRNITVHNHKE